LYDYVVLCRRKLQARISELEAAAEQAKGKAGKLEKDKSRMTMEIKDISIQLDEANAVVNDYAKRLKQAEHQATDLQKRCEELNSDLQNANSENQKVLAELTRLKTSVNDQQAKIDALTRDNNKLTGIVHVVVVVIVVVIG